MTKDIFDVQEKIIIITGGLGQLGTQFTLALTERGAKVASFDLQSDEKEIAPTLRSWVGRDHLQLIRVDVTKKQSIQEGLKKVIGHWGIPDALINNAALDAPPQASAEENGPFENYPETAWDKTLEVNLKGTFLSCQIIGKQMAESGRGSIINVGSIYGTVSPDQRVYEYRHRKGDFFYKPVAYSASKAGLLNLTRYLATYWADKNVRVNTVTFGGVANQQDEPFLKNYCARVPMGRMARPDEYNGAIIFLLSDASSYMTGSNLVIDGGWTAW